MHERDKMRWIWRGSALTALAIGWLFIAWQNHFHISAPVVFVCLGYLAVVATVYNLWRTGAAAVAGSEDEGDSTWAKPAGALGELEREKRTLLKAIKEAEFDHQMGKLSQRDVDDMIRTYRARAIEVIKEIDRLGHGAVGTRREQIMREVRARLELEAKSPKKPESKAESKPVAKADAKADAKAAAGSEASAAQGSKPGKGKKKAGKAAGANEAASANNAGSEAASANNAASAPSSANNAASALASANNAASALASANNAATTEAPAPDGNGVEPAVPGEAVAGAATGTAGAATGTAGAATGTAGTPTAEDKAHRRAQAAAAAQALDDELNADSTTTVEPKRDDPAKEATP